MLRPIMLKYAQDPVMLHEFLHVYHAKMMPRGFENKGIKDFYNQAKSKQLFDKKGSLRPEEPERILCGHPEHIPAWRGHRPLPLPTAAPETQQTYTIHHPS